MGYYKFHPKNHICSFVCTGIVLLIQLDMSTRPIKKALITGLVGVSTTFFGISMREDEEKKVRKKIVDYVSENKEATVAQIANSMDLSGQEARRFLNSLVIEERLEMLNRASDMILIYILAS